MTTQPRLGFIGLGVMGRPMGAQNATLASMAGGKPRVFKRVQPLFARLGNRENR